MLHRKAEKELEKLNLDVKGRIIEAFKEMKEDPFAGDVKLVKGLKGVFRRRVGGYRIFFTVSFEENAVVILRISPGEKAYDGV
jgi:mRNA-degrading endonuclease RelE of RelBE toxin-antitoxin system